MTSITITDPALLAQIAAAAAGVIEIKDPDGRIVAIIRPSGHPGLPPGANPSPLSDEERAALRAEARRRTGPGLSLEEAWKEVDRRLGGR
ncbi:MAG: hypothetical protein K2X82_27680 [Gemmataceae bacterium]|nr:hypothetical protein [Gemmataceae bacterium]